MAREDVNIKVSADVAQAVQMWKAMEEGPQGMANELDSLSKKGKRSTDEMTAGFDRLIGKVSSTITKLGLVKELLDTFVRTSKELDSLKTDNTLNVDTQSRTLFSQISNQKGRALTAAEQASITSDVLKIAAARGVEQSEAFAVTTQAVSSGATIDQASDPENGIANAMLETLNAMNSTAAARGERVDAGGLTKAFIQYLRASGKELTGANVKQLGVAAQSLYTSTNFQIPDLERFAEDAGQVQQFTGLDEVESMAAYTLFLDKVGKAKGSTSFLAGTRSLATSGGNRTVQRGLARLGLQHTDVDMDGESFMEALELIASRAEGLSKSERNVAFTEMFGQEGLLFGQTFANREALEDLRTRIQSTNNTEGFVVSRDVIEQGRLAARNRADTQDAIAFNDPARLDPQVVEQVFRRRMVEEGFGATRIGLALDGVGPVPGFRDSMGVMEPEEAVKYYTPSFPLQEKRRDEFIESVISESQSLQLSGDLRITIEDSSGLSVPARNELENINLERRR